MTISTSTNLAALADQIVVGLGVNFRSKTDCTAQLKQGIEICDQVDSEAASKLRKVLEKVIVGERQLDDELLATIQNQLMLITLNIFLQLWFDSDLRKMEQGD